MREAWNVSQQANDSRIEKIKALTLAKECYAMKLDLLINATMIHPKFDELITALKSAQSKEGDQYSLDKSKSANNDLTDALRLVLEGVNK